MEQQCLRFEDKQRLLKDLLCWTSARGVEKNTTRGAWASVRNKREHLVRRKIDIAVLLYKRKVLTLARAAHWVGMTRLEFQKALVERGFPINYSIEDFETDLKTLHSMAG